MLREHPAIDDCIVLGVPDARFGEMVVALVVTRTAADEAGIRGHCRDRGLAGYKIPRRVITLDDMRRAPNGKADYKMLRSLAAAELGIE